MTTQSLRWDSRCAVCRGTLPADSTGYQVHDRLLCAEGRGRCRLDGGSAVITKVTTAGLTNALCHTIDTDAVLPCGPDPELWFADTPAGVELAKSLCQQCPVQTECLAGAAARREPHGVWGGQLFINGQVVAYKRPRGRPRKAR